jgi:N6-adenosine-specific RNA methylase IME4
MGRAADAWYDCMSLDDIKALPVENMAATDCVLLMWTTDPFLRLSFDVIDSWGFVYKTVGFYWMKTPVTWFGTGYWTRANPEQCLLATRGSPHRLNADVRKLITSERREHSRKPDETYERIERLCTGPYLELFARNKRDGWDSIGNEAELGPQTERRWKSSRGPGTKKKHPKLDFDISLDF